MRSSMSIYKNVLDWDDSAALEAFQKAKAQFWAKYNGLRSDVSLPDPDMYIDKVNYDAIIDPELIEDLYKEPPAPANQVATGNDGLDSFLATDKPIPATGWDDAEDNAPSGVFAALPRLNNWDVHIDKPFRQNEASDANNTCSAWDVNPVKLEDNGDRGGNKWSCNDGWTDGFARNEEWGSKQHSLWDNRVDKSWGPCQSNNESGGRHSRKRYRGGRFGSRFQIDDYQKNNNSWRNCRGRNNRSHSNEHTFDTWQSRNNQEPHDSVAAWD
ncbi:uncharacterized protein LOC120283325 [Dioscorea cayenensis subsp. rotundata]|uniref:Uncharacterized protein LOC120283325 n=1 Tax=Dioscorea cayennensis subsp. rotundata TaxID=55577 RepID=A0AB40D0X3_DIOCR|nr:uncharacterized protein LOC120283325 [Dioscorea cayenensis subsp. rotundata]XP_039145911.1 uncharacterized protein LOC120283325 [Dioscorea cayenensis subsp. rotundata]